MIGKEIRLGNDYWEVIAREIMMGKWWWGNEEIEDDRQGNGRH